MHGPSIQAAVIVALIATVLGCDSARRAPVRVAAVGDSITFGEGRDDAYPAQLAKLLGDAYHVRNFGVPGATAAEGGDTPYVQQPAYRAALSYAPEIVIIMLGTNDTKAQNWTHRSTARADLVRLVNSFRELASQPQVVVALPPPVFQRDATYIDGGRLELLLATLRAVAADTRSLVLDLQRTFADKKSLLPDQIHPNAEGNALIAQEAHNLIEQAHPSPRRPTGSAR